MTKQMLKDYIELLEKEKFLDARHRKYLVMAKEELQGGDYEIPGYKQTMENLDKLTICK